MAIDDSHRSEKVTDCCVGLKRLVTVNPARDIHRNRLGCCGNLDQRTGDRQIMSDRLHTASRMPSANSPPWQRPKRIVRRVLSLVQQGTFDYVIQEFYAVVYQAWSITPNQCAESSSSSAGSDDVSGSLIDSNTSATSTGAGKRSLASLYNDRPDRDGDDVVKKPRSTAKAETECRRYACPYFKRSARELELGHLTTCGQGKDGKTWLN